MKPNLGYYVQKINDIVKETETIGEGMNEYYEEIRKAIDTEKTTEITSERLTEIKGIFTEGTQKYEELLEKVKVLKPTAQVIGIHKKFERSYLEYIAGCSEMTDSIDPESGIKVEQFNAAEEKQDKATDDLSFAITRMSNLLLKNNK